MKAELNNFLKTAEALSILMHPFAEVVIHDLEKDQIEAIYNPFSKREKGDSSYLDRVDFNKEEEIPDIIGPYEKLNYDGRKLKSISIVIKNDKDAAVGFLCINLDISIFDKYREILNNFLTMGEFSADAKTTSIFKDDLYEQINMYVQRYCMKNHVAIDGLTRNQKKDLILELKYEGALKGKNSSQYIARALGISRATVYNYLKPEDLS